MTRYLFLLLVLAIPCAIVADDCRDCGCAHCGCQSKCRRVCHVICEWKDIKETVYTCKCEDICIPRCSEKLCTKYGCECCPECGSPCTCDSNGNCNCKCGCNAHCREKLLYSVWEPSDCARIRTVNKLMKIEVTRKVPTYRWVVEYCCDRCCCEIMEESPPGNKIAPIAAPPTPPPDTEPGQSLPPQQQVTPKQIVPVQSPLPQRGYLRPADLQPDELQPTDLQREEKRSGFTPTAQAPAKSPMSWGKLLRR